LVINNSLEGLKMLSWAAWIWKILRMKPHEDITIPKRLVRHPLEDGFTKTFGEYQGQIMDYELTLADGRRIHVREFKDYYKAHWDRISPKVDPLEHLRVDAPGWWVLFAGLAGAALSYLMSKRPENTVNGLILGMIFGVLTIES